MHLLNKIEYVNNADFKARKLLTNLWDVYVNNLSFKNSDKLFFMDIYFNLFTKFISNGHLTLDGGSANVLGHGHSAIIIPPNYIKCS